MQASVGTHLTTIPTQPGKMFAGQQQVDLIIDAPYEETVNGERIQHFLKKDFGPGKWQSEPDRITFKSHGMDCLMLRHAHSGHWCGYVAVEKGHPLYNQDYDSANRVADCHGGFTFGRPCSDEPDFGVCHAHQGDDKAFWFGFDFAHLGDDVPMIVHLRRTNPGMQAISRKYPGSHDFESYKDEDFVRAECVRVAKQFRALRWWPLYAWKLTRYNADNMVQRYSWRVKAWHSNTKSTVAKSWKKMTSRFSKS